MIELLINKIILYFEKYNMIYDNELVQYALRIIIRYSVFFIFIFPLSIYIGILDSFLIFLICFYCLRIHFGGFHFKNNQMCLLFSIAIMLFFPYINKYIFLQRTQLLVITLFLICCFIIIGPIDNKKKRISLNEKKHHKKIGIIILILYCLIIGIIKENYAQIVLLSIVFELICIMIPYIILIFKRRKTGYLISNKNKI